MPAEFASDRGYGSPRHAASNDGERLGDPVVLVGAREVHHQAQRSDRRRRRQPVAHARHVGRPEAQAIHPGVDLDEDLERPREHRGLEHPHLLRIVHDGGQPPLRELGQFAFREEAFEHQDATRVAALAQVVRRFRLHQREAVGVLERGQHARQPVSVRVGLDDGEDLGARRPFADAAQVLAQRGKVDLGVERSGHAAAVGGIGRPERRLDRSAPPLVACMRRRLRA